jgi:hypothetical protein
MYDIGQWKSNPIVSRLGVEYVIFLRVEGVHVTVAENASLVVNIQWTHGIRYPTHAQVRAIPV